MRIDASFGSGVVAFGDWPDHSGRQLPSGDWLGGVEAIALGCDGDGDNRSRWRGDALLSGWSGAIGALPHVGLVSSMGAAEPAD